MEKLIKAVRKKVKEESRIDALWHVINMLRDEIVELKERQAEFEKIMFQKGISVQERLGKLEKQLQKKGRK